MNNKHTLGLITFLYLESLIKVPLYLPFMCQNGLK